MNMRIPRLAIAACCFQSIAAHISGQAGKWALVHAANWTAESRPVARVAGRSFIRRGQHVHHGHQRLIVDQIVFTGNNNSSAAQRHQADDFLSVLGSNINNRRAQTR